MAISISPFVYSRKLITRTTGLCGALRNEFERNIIAALKRGDIRLGDILFSYAESVPLDLSSLKEVLDEVQDLVDTILANTHQIGKDKIGDLKFLQERISNISLRFEAELLGQACEKEVAEYQVMIASQHRIPKNAYCKEPYSKLH
jgi:hypothetical protein